MSNSLYVTEITSPLRSVRSDKDLVKAKQHNASASKTKPTAITPNVAAHHGAEQKSHSLTDVPDYLERHPASEGYNGFSCYTSTSNEGTPRLLPVHNGSRDLLPISGNDAKPLDFPRRSSQQTLPALHSNITTLHKALSKPVQSIPCDASSLNNTVEHTTPELLSMPASSGRSTSCTSEDPAPATSPSLTTRTTSNEVQSTPVILDKAHERNASQDIGFAPREGITASTGTSELQPAGRQIRDPDRSGKSQAEKRAETTVVDTELAANARSRKSSHMMQIFKDTIPEQPKGQDKRRPDLSTAQSNSANEDGESKKHKSWRPPRSTSEEAIANNSDIIGQENIPPQYTNVPEEYLGSEPEPHQEPHRPLRHISNEAAKGISTGAKPSALPHQLLAGTQDYHSTQNFAGDDEDGFTSDKEHVSSAIYYPHKAPSPDTIDHVVGDVESESKQKEHYVTLSRPETRRSLGEEDDSLLVDHVPRPPSSKASDSGVSSASDSEHSCTDGETTPKASPAARGAFLGHRARRGRRPQTVPLPTIELLPFKHQVGGHTILYKFHKKGVTKPLVNEENKFYELVEQAHPELLEFLTGYVLRDQPYVQICFED